MKNSGKKVKKSFAAWNIKYLLTGKYAIHGGHIPADSVIIPNDFFGICVASSPAPETDDKIINYLNDLNIKHVRLDWTYSSPGSHTERFLTRLLDADFRVCLHIIQPFYEAKAMPAENADHNWRLFIQTTADTWGSRLDMIEIGSTCNRKKWAGYNLSSFLSAWNSAHEVLRNKNITIAGPNVTDFEPPYNIGLLGMMKTAATLPDIHTNNIFAERATEPERFDHKIAGYKIAGFIKFNLVKKIRLLAKISDSFGIRQLISTHAAWSMRRIARILTDTEEKQADYVSRYAILAAAAGSLRRMYWGPLVSQREGIVDDGTDEYPELPHVTAYLTVPGQSANYRSRPAFSAYKTVVKLLSASRYLRPLRTSNGLEIHEFDTEHGKIHAAWTTNGNCADIESCYSKDLISRASARSRDGDEIKMPRLITESPIYISWKSEVSPQLLISAELTPRLRIFNEQDVNYTPVRTEHWEGMCVNRDEIFPEGRCLLLPEALENARNRNVMRDKRNCVWAAENPSCPESRIVVKRLQIKKMHKKIIQFFRRPRAVRSWNAAQELMRRGINTPRPLAFFYSTRNSSLAKSYFIYEMFKASDSCRDAFTAFAAGDPEYKGIPVKTFYSRLALFINKMHERGVFFRDLSAGNVLFDPSDPMKPEFCLIDTARSRFFEHPLPMKLRLSDLTRITHPLTWEARTDFVGTCLSETGHSFTTYRKIPFFLYDLKHNIKRRIKGKKKNQGALR